MNDEPIGVLKYRFEFENGSVFLCEKYEELFGQTILHGAYKNDGSAYVESCSPLTVTSDLHRTKYELRDKDKFVPAYFVALTPDIKKIAGEA